MQEKKYSFLDFDVPAIVENFLELKLIELPKMKRPNNAGKTIDPNYCKYHRLPLNDSRIQPRGQRAIGAIKLGLTIGDMQSSAWLYVIVAKNSYNVLLGKPWIHENRVVPSNYHQCLKYYEGGVEKTIVTDDKPFTEAESYFADAKFYLKNHIVKELKADDVMKIKNDEFTTKRAEVAPGKVKVAAKEAHPNPNKYHRGKAISSSKKVAHVLRYVPKIEKKEGESFNLQTGLTLPIKRIEAIKMSSKLLRKSVSQNPPQNIALPTKRTDEGFDPNAYKLFAKAGYNPNEPSKLGNLPSEAATRQPHEGLGYKQSLLVRFSIRKASNNCITMEDEPATSNRLSIFHQLEKSTERTYGVKTTIDALKKVNLGTDEEPRPTYLSALLVVNEERNYIEFLKEYKYVFDWSYKDKSGLDHKVEVYHLAVKNGAHPVKQAQRRFRPDLVPLIKTEINKPIEDGFTREVKHSTWVSSIVPGSQQACPKDEFPLPISELVIDAITGYEAMSFMNGLSRYNQIRMYPKDEDLITFHTPNGIYCYKFQQFEIVYIPQKAIKGQALADFLADHLIPNYWELTDEVPDEDAMVIEFQPP
uniref:Uncharacterized protein n=1 Tax=Nicotiana tabacum TaxID=4097 RepID=A0A1S3Z9S7_TOBAC|nr:PREDICTED: uncharacterized protein LOC107784579 [Nicotiana tabacum]